MNFVRRLPESEKQRPWGVWITNCGRERTPPHVSYPNAEHPSEYYFTWTKGRRLGEYQIIYILDGTGEIEFEGRRKQKIGAGSVIILTPDHWHRYRPSSKTGWEEAWIGFSGSFANNVVCAPFFDARGSVIKLNTTSEFEADFLELLASAESHGTERPYSLGPHLMTILARLAERVSRPATASKREVLMRRAQFHIARHLSEVVDFVGLANRLGMGYTLFRREFKAECGLAPLEYQLSLRLKHITNLLTNSTLSLEDIALSSGFKSQSYFTRFFTARTGTSPERYRAARSK